MKFNRLYFASAIALAATFVTPVYAQKGANEARESDDNVIIVTATKRASDIQDIPASISQIGGDDLEARGIQNIENLAVQIPNLTFGSFGNNTFVTIRGIGTTVDSGVAEPSVATYVDGIFLPRSTMAVIRQVDLDRVEVLRGPQGTLYGRNATGGAINFVPLEPSDTFEGGITARVENRNGFGANAFVSGPLGDQVAVRLSAGFENQDGFVQVENTGQDVADTDVFYGRFAFKVEPSDTFKINLAVQHESDGSANTWQSVTTAPVNVLGLVSAFQGLGFPLPTPNFTTEPNRLVNDGLISGDAHTTIASAKIDWEISDAVSIRSTTGYVDHQSIVNFDADATDFFFADAVNFNRESESFSQEINLYGEVGGIDWLIGGYFFDEEYAIALPVDFNAAALGAGGPLDRFPVVAGNLVEETTSYALFADVTVPLTDSLRLLLGARLNWEDKDFTFFGAPSPAGSLDTNDFLPKVGFQYDVNPDVNIYGQWQQGIKSGGHQFSAPTLFEPEEITSYEFGFKSTLLDGDLTFNGAAFFYDYTNLQATVTIDATTTEIQSGDAEIFGLEAELAYQASDILSFNLGASFLDSKYTRLSSVDQTQATLPLVDLAGEELIRAPNFTFNAGAELSIPINSGVLGEITFRGDVFYSDSYKLTFFNYPETTQGSYATVNLSVALTDSSDMFQVRGYVNNLTDQVILNNASFLVTTGAFIGIHSEPLNGGVSVSARF